MGELRIADERRRFTRRARREQKKWKCEIVTERKRSQDPHATPPRGAFGSGDLNRTLKHQRMRHPQDARIEERLIAQKRAMETRNDGIVGELVS